MARGRTRRSRREPQQPGSLGRWRFVPCDRVARARDGAGRRRGFCSLNPARACLQLGCNGSAMIAVASMVPLWPGSEMLPRCHGVICALLLAGDELRHPRRTWMVNVLWPVAALSGSAWVVRHVLPIQARWRLLLCDKVLGTVRDYCAPGPGHAAFCLSGQVGTRRKETVRLDAAGRNTAGAWRPCNLTALNLPA